MLRIVSTCFVVNTMQLETTRIRILSASWPRYLQDQTTVTILTISQAANSFDISVIPLAKSKHPHPTAKTYAFQQTPRNKSRYSTSADMCQHQMVLGACGHTTYSFVERTCAQAHYSHSSASNLFPAPHRITTHTIRTPRYCQGCGPRPTHVRHDHGKCTVTSLSAQFSSLSVSELHRRKLKGCWRWRYLSSSANGKCNI
jgi:hypothetical protein